jgi:hypothetical protein
MPLDGSPCASTGMLCGYGCNQPYASYHHVAQCRASGWTVFETHCDPPFSLDAGPMPDAMAEADAAGDAAADAAPPDGS